MTAMSDEELARSVLAAAKTGGSNEPMADYFAGHDWAQAAISAMCTGVKDGVQFAPDQIREVLARWTPDMGPVLADRLQKALTQAA